MKAMQFSEISVVVRRPYLRAEWIEQVPSDPIRTQVQPNGRVRRWGFIAEAGKYLRVIPESDGETVHNAFFDRRFRS
jgi:hypothetical protein